MWKTPIYGAAWNENEHLDKDLMANVWNGEDLTRNDISLRAEDECMINIQLIDIQNEVVVVVFYWLEGWRANEGWVLGEEKTKLQES